MTLTTMLLAGGSSRRMRVDKATLMIAGEPLWQRQLRVLSGLRPETLWVSGQSGLRWCPIGTEIVTDKMPSRGPLSGVAEGLCLLKTSHLLVLAIDLPQMTSNHLRILFGLAKPGKGVIPLNGGGLEPLCAVYPAEAAAAAGAASRLTAALCSTAVARSADDRLA